MNYDVWMEGYATNGERSSASYIGTYDTNSFVSACRKAVDAHGYWSKYDPVRNTIWGCRLFDNMASASRTFS